jgi:hypothetical protein
MIFMSGAHGHHSRAQLRKLETDGIGIRIGDDRSIAVFDLKTGMSEVFDFHKKVK